MEKLQLDNTLNINIKYVQVPWVLILYINTVHSRTLHFIHQDHPCGNYLNRVIKADR